MDHIFMKPLFKQSPTIWALSREMLVQPYTFLFRVPPCSDFEKNMDVCIIPVELFKNRFTSNLNKSNSILSNLLLPSHLVKCGKSWTGFFSYIMVSQSVALSQEVAVVLHHFADFLYKKYKKNYTGPFRLCEVKCRWLKILQIMVLQPKSQLFCMESSFISQFQQRGWREVAASQAAAALSWEGRNSTAWPGMWQGSHWLQLIFLVVFLSFLPGTLIQNKYYFHGSAANCTL